MRTSAKCAANAPAGARPVCELRVDFAVGVQLVEFVAGQDVDVALSDRGAVDEVDASVRGRDVRGVRALHRGGVIVGDGVQERPDQVAGGVVDRAAQRHGEP